ncbi:MAG: hypothetical protein FIA94_10355 [Nitrospirae bacterium]|nr:hypothetical protein [Nitrospirota bacterium]
MTSAKKKRLRPVADPGSGDRAKGPTEERSEGEGAEDSCRCKEVSQKTFPDLLRLMISDLAFWKKNKRRT